MLLPYLTVGKQCLHFLYIKHPKISNEVSICNSPPFKIRKGPDNSNPLTHEQWKKLKQRKIEVWFNWKVLIGCLMMPILTYRLSLYRWYKFWGAVYRCCPRVASPLVSLLISMAFLYTAINRM